MIGCQVDSTACRRLVRGPFLSSNPPAAASTSYRKASQPFSSTSSEYNLAVGDTVNLLTPSPLSC